MLFKLRVAGSMDLGAASFCAGSFGRRKTCTTERRVEVKRREFLRRVMVCGTALVCGTELNYQQECRAGAAGDMLAGIQIIDAHAHPDMDYSGLHWVDTSASYRYMQEAGMAVSFFSAIGHRGLPADDGRPNYEFAEKQLKWWLNGIVREQKVKLVLKTADIPRHSGADQPPGAILAIEGGDALDGRLARIDDFHRLGVRMITLVHYRNNQIGDIMRVWPGRDPGPYSGGLTSFGRDVIAKMEDRGVVVDVAHAHPATFRDVLSVVTKPVVDSHTNPCPGTSTSCGRMRTWQEMEMVAKTGGVTCTWPIAYSALPRKTVADWAKEIMTMKRNLGIEHVGLGTDGGGYLNSQVEGYRNERDLGNLAEAMLEVGLSREDVAAYMGGNVLRVLKDCIDR